MEEKLSNRGIEIEKLTEIERKVLPLLKEEKSYEEVAKKLNEKEVKVLRAFQWLESKGLIKVKEVERERIILTERGKEILKDGFPEEILYNLIKEKGEMSINEAKEKLRDSFSIALGVLKKLNVIKIENGKIKLLSTFDFKNYELKKCLQDLESCNIRELEKRGIVKKEKVKDFIAKATDKGLKLIDEIKKFKVELIEKLTSKMLKDKSWKGKKFRKYDVKIKVPKIRVGRRSLLRRLSNKIKEIWLSLGFEEMEGEWVTTSFFNFDLMFFSQDHPDREIMGTYHLDLEDGEVDEEVNEILKKVYLNGYNTGSLGKQEIFDPSKTKKMILRTHTTSITFQYLYRNLFNKLKVGKKIKIPGKYFMIGRVFRVDVFDYKHLPEFHQVEGFVIDKNLSFKDLLSYLKEFYSYFGIKKLRFKPVYNPYTEPSTEVFAWLEEKKKWIEIGNSGMFRKETLLPLGIKENVIAWGLALERLAMLVYGINDIRKVHGHLMDIDEISNSKALFKIK